MQRCRGASRPVTVTSTAQQTRGPPKPPGTWQEECQLHRDPVSPGPRTLLAQGEMPATLTDNTPRGPEARKGRVTAWEAGCCWRPGTAHVGHSWSRAAIIPFRCVSDVTDGSAAVALCDGGTRGPSQPLSPWPTLSHPPPPPPAPPPGPGCPGLQAFPLLGAAIPSSLSSWFLVIL